MIRSSITGSLVATALALHGLIAAAQNNSADSLATQPTAATAASSSPEIIQIEQARIKCVHKPNISAQADGLIKEMTVDEGSIVKKGDVLLVIDDRLALAELKVAEKELEAAAAQAKQTAHVEYATKATELARAEYTELSRLYSEQGAVSYFEIRKKKLEYDRALAGTKVAEVDHSKDTFSAEVAREKVNAAKVQLELRKIVAPYSGVIIERMRDQGDWIKAGEPVFRLCHMDEMRVEVRVNVEGRSVQQLRNAPMKVRIPIGQGHEIPISTRIEYDSPELVLGECRVWAKIPNQMVGNSWLLRDGMEGKVEIELGAPAGGQ